MLKKPALHIQIIIALILGALFGSLFNVNPHKLIIIYKSGNSEYEKTIQNWDKVAFILQNAEQNKDSISITHYGKYEQIQIIKYFKALEKKDKSYVSVTVYFKNKPYKLNFKNIIAIKKAATIATQIKPIGTIFIRLLSLLAIPLVIASLIVGAASLEDIKNLGRIGGKTFAIYITTTAIAITIGLISANIIAPGKKVSDFSKNRLIGEYQAESSETIIENIEVDIPDFIVNIVPKNPINAMAEGQMLQIVFFAVLFGVTLTFIEKKKADSVLNFFEGVSETMIKMVDFIMLIAPFGVFALIASTIADFGIGIITTLFWYIITVLIGLTFHTIVVYSLIVKYLGRMSPRKFFKGMQTAQAIAFSTSSSAATLPVTFDCTENKLGLPKQITGFVLPLGATINMDGTALYQGVAAVFIAQVYGFDLTIAQQLTVVFTAVLASIGTAPVPGVGIIMLIMILQAIHIPPEGIALIIGVDRILDMCRTITNISGDAAVATAIAGTEKARQKRLLRVKS